MFVFTFLKKYFITREILYVPIPNAITLVNFKI